MDHCHGAAREHPIIDYIDDYIFEGRFILVPEDGENLRSRKLPIAYFADGRFWVNNHAHIIKARPDVADDRFIQGALQASDIGAFVTGAAQPKLSQANMRQIPLVLPPLGYQKTVASILDALDDPIEDNRRRVEVLEQMAQAIYRESFVRFRFPGHEDATFVGSPLGPIPEGCRVARLSEIATVNRQTRKPAIDETFKYLDISCLGERSVGELSVTGGAEAPGRARRVVQSGDVVWSMVRPNRRAHAMLVEPGSDWIASTGLAVLTATSVSSDLLYEMVSAADFSDYLVSQESEAAPCAGSSRCLTTSPPRSGELSPRT